MKHPATPKGRARFFARAARMWLRMKYGRIDVDRAGPPLFVHVPKAAGTSVKRVARVQSTFGHRTWREYRASVTGDLPVSFALVRHPVDRAVSAFTFLQRGGLTEMDAIWAWWHLRDYASFDDFAVRGLHRCLDWVHFRPQVAFVTDDEGRVAVDHLLHVESLHDTWPAFAARVGLPAVLPRVNASRTPSKDGAGALGVSRRAYDRVMEVYAADVATFGYDRAFVPPGSPVTPEDRGANRSPTTVVHDS